MIDIVQYRAQIGLFSQKTFRKKYLKSDDFFCKSSRNRNRFSENFMQLLSTVLKIAVFCMMFLPPTQAAHLSPSWPAWCVSSSCTVRSSSTTAVAWSQSVHLHFSSDAVWRVAWIKYRILDSCARACTCCVTCVALISYYNLQIDKRP